MAAQSQIEETYNYMDEVFRAAYGEHADCTGAELFNDSVVRDGLANHGWKDSLGDEC